VPSRGAYDQLRAIRVTITVPVAANAVVLVIAYVTVFPLITGATPASMVAVPSPAPLSANSGSVSVIEAASRA